MVLKNYKPLDTDKIMKQLHNGKVASENPSSHLCHKYHRLLIDAGRV